MKTEPTLPINRVTGAHALVQQQALLTPDRMAVATDGTEISYGELISRAECIADGLRKIGVEPGSVVALYLDRSVEQIAAILAVLNSGAAYLPLDLTYPTERLAFVLLDGGPLTVLTQHHLRTRVPVGRYSVLNIEDFNVSTHSPRETCPWATGNASNAYVIYTSGSTGRPKGVVMPHGPLINLVQWQRHALPLPPAGRVLQFAPLSFDVSFQEIFTTLAEGGTLVLMPEELRRDPEGLLRHLSMNKVSRLYLPFVALQQLAEAAAASQIPPLDLRDVITAGEQLQISPAIRSFFKALPGARLHNHYGPTETHVVTAHTLSGDPAQWPVLPPIGRPIHNTTVHVLDEQRKPVAPGTPGELYFSGACVARGYLNRPELTAARFLVDPDDRANARMYRTGDLGRVLGDGTIEYLGRADDQVKIRGHRVELGEVESALRDHPGVADCVVVAQARGTEKILVAHVQARDGATWLPDDLRKHLAAILPEALVPAAFARVTRFPLTPSGKIDRRSLPPIEFGAGTQATATTPPQGDLERRIATVWEAVLGWSGIGVLDSFFAVGGTSVLMAEVQRRLRRELERDIPIALLFQFPTIRQLAQRLAQTGADTGGHQTAVAERAARQREAAARMAAARQRAPSQ